MSTSGIVVAAGSGTRFGVPKQFEAVAGARLVDRAVHAAAFACDEVVVVLPAGVQWDGRPVAAAVPGGSTRSASVRAGLDAIAGSATVVVVHDAALVEAAGGEVVVVPGDPRNLKVTTPADLVVAAALLAPTAERR